MRFSSVVCSNCPRKPLSRKSTKSIFPEGIPVTGLRRIMQRSIKLFLNKFDVIPNTLRAKSNVDVAAKEVDVDLARLYHHYFMDTRGVALPDPDPAQFEHLALMLPISEFRVRGDGFGVATTFRRHRCNEMGQAFCRWFLAEHLNIVYFAHMEHVLARGLHPGFGGCQIERSGEGDVPDYFCAESVDKVFLAEAKGRTSSISFKNAEFKKWRAQFDRVIVKDHEGKARRLKGFIIGSRFATERNAPSVKSALYAEDPETPGEGPLDQIEVFGAATIALHYADIATKLRQPILASALARGFAVPPEIWFPATVWEFQTEPLKGVRFVGGYFPSKDGIPPLRVEGDRLQFVSRDPLRLDVGSGTFFGVEEGIFRSLIDIVRGSDAAARQVSPLPILPPFYSAISLLRDGSILGPIDFFAPIGLLTL